MAGVQTKAVQLLPLDYRSCSVSGPGARTTRGGSHLPLSSGPHKCASLQFQNWPLDGRAAQAVVVHWPERDRVPSRHLPVGWAAWQPLTSSSPEKSGIRGLLWLRRVRLSCRPCSGSGARPSWNLECSRSSPPPRECSPETERAWDERWGVRSQGGMVAQLPLPT